MHSSTSQQNLMQYFVREQYFRCNIEKYCTKYEYCSTVFWMLTPSPLTNTWGQWGKVCPAEASYWNNSFTVLGRNLPASVQPAPTATSTHPPTSQIVFLFFGRLIQVSGAHKDGLTKDGLNYYHSAVLICTLPEHKTRHGICYPWGCEQHQQC